MLKALKFLKEFEKDINYFIDSFDEYSYDEGLHTAKIYKIKIFEAIAELESLNSNDNKVKTCEGCKFGKFGIDSLGVEVECSLVWDCSRGRKDEWEPK